jgi:type I restriction enzyme R subunit
MASLLNSSFCLQPSAVQHLTSNHLDPVARVTICTIQRLYAMLRGEELLEDLDEKSGFEIAAADQRPRDVQYCPTIPIETFDFVIADTAQRGSALHNRNAISQSPLQRDKCHRSIYNLWRQVLEYFDAFLIGLTATPGKQAIGFFNQNLLSDWSSSDKTSSEGGARRVSSCSANQYPHERAVANGVNGGYDLFRIKTEVTERAASSRKASSSTAVTKERKNCAPRTRGRSHLHRKRVRPGSLNA